MDRTGWQLELDTMDEDALSPLVTWDAIVDGVENIRYDLRTLRTGVVELEQAFNL